MAMIYIDGFDTYNQVTDKWTGVGGGSQGHIDLTGTLSRTGLGCYVATAPAGPYQSFTKRSQLIAGVAFQPPSSPTGTIYGFIANGVNNVNTVNQVSLQVNNTGSISVISGNLPFPATLGTTAPNILFGGVYAYVECNVTFNSVSGTVVLKVNGVQVLNLSGVNTDPAGITGADTFQIQGAGGGAICTYDDLYLFDGTGGVHNGFAGAVRVYEVVPTSDQSPLQWTPSTGTAHFSLVNGVPAESQTTYVSTGTVSNNDQYLYNLTSVPAASTIIGVQHSMYAELDAAGSGTLASDCQSNISSAQALSTTPHIYFYEYDTDPVISGAWTLANLINRTFGPNRAS